MLNFTKELMAKITILKQNPDEILIENPLTSKDLILIKGFPMISLLLITIKHSLQVMKVFTRYYPYPPMLPKKK